MKTPLARVEVSGPEKAGPRRRVRLRGPGRGRQDHRGPGLHRRARGHRVRR
ncbi:hypothetical protein [Nocardioides convexus]|uniref:hypothetical protein n=1 Tax=Nocardioides convexus TaxID=2712224 RepID=UPI0031016339